MRSTLAADTALSVLFDRPKLAHMLPCTGTLSTDLSCELDNDHVSLQIRSFYISFSNTGLIDCFRSIAHGSCLHGDKLLGLSDLVIT